MLCFTLIQCGTEFLTIFKMTEEFEVPETWTDGLVDGSGQPISKRRVLLSFCFAVIISVEVHGNSLTIISALQSV